MIRDLERESNLKARQDICTSLAALKDPRTFNLFIKLLKTQPELGFCSAVALGDLGDSRAIDPLMENLFLTNKYGEKYINGGVLLALSKIGDGKTLNFLIEVQKRCCSTNSATSKDDKKAVRKAIQKLEHRLKR